MAISTSKSYHARSISLPSRPHPLIPQCNELLSIFTAAEAVLSSSSIRNNLVQLSDLYASVDDLIQLPESRQALSREDDMILADVLLNGSLRLMEVCGSAKESLLQNKECAQELQSSLRRRSGSETEIAKEAARYLIQRRLIKKANLKSMKNSKDLSHVSRDQDNSSIISILKQVQATTMAVLETLMAFIVGQKGTSSKWSLVSKLMHSKRVSNQAEEACINEFDEVDAALKSLIDQKAKKTIPIKNVQVLLGDIELSTQDLEEGVENLFRQLIKIRVSLLNLLSH